MVGSLLSNFPLNFKEIIADQMKIRAITSNIEYPFPYFIIRLCEAAHVPKVTGLDHEVTARKMHNLIKFDENHPILVLGKGVEVEGDMIMAGEVQTATPTIGSIPKKQLLIPEFV